jgi:hypothetical protein
MSHGELDVMLPLTVSDLRDIALMLSYGVAGPIDLIYAKYAEAKIQCDLAIQAAVTRYNAEGHAEQFQTDAFWQELNTEIATLGGEIVHREGGGNPINYPQQNIVELRMLLEVLNLAPNPEYLKHDHFLFTMSTTYHSHFAARMDRLRTTMDDGGLVYGSATGGTGGRFGAGNVIKPVVNFHYGNEPDASYLRLLFRKWSAFTDRFPAKRKGVAQILISAFTQDAVLSVVTELMADAGIENLAIV